MEAHNLLVKQFEKTLRKVLELNTVEGLTVDQHNYYVDQIVPALVECYKSFGPNVKDEDFVNIALLLDRASNDFGKLRDAFLSSVRANH